MRKIDVFNHIWPEAFYTRAQKLAPDMRDMSRRVRNIPMITAQGRRDSATLIARRRRSRAGTASVVGAAVSSRAKLSPMPATSRPARM